MGSGAAATALPPPNMTTAEPEKSFTCPTCLRVFNKKANLKVHSRKHTGEKPYACSKPGCGRSFMWKSSVTFHEQNCPSSKKKDDSSPPPMPVSTKGVQKRPKSSRNGADLRTPPKQHAASASRRRPSRTRSPPTTPMTPEDLPRDSAHHVRDDVVLATHGAPPSTRDTRVVTDIHAVSSSFPTHHMPPSPASHAIALANSAMATSMAHATGANTNPLTAAAVGMQQTSPLPPAAFANAFITSPPPPSSMMAHPPPYGTPDGHTLPAPSTLLGEKRLQSGGGRPPVIPGSLPKHFLNLQAPKDNDRKLFDLRVPASPQVPSGAKPPMFNSKMPKMPIAMELDDSDDEGPMKIVGAQDAFMRTGNPFGGFAPPTRCSPLPVCSPIVCPGISPMPLSPLAPFSPLPPDSPAHNAPNPVHPPLNQPSRPSNTNW